MNGLEGNGAARLVQLMQRYGKNDGINITVATVTKSPPALAIHLDGDPFDLSGDEIVVAEYLVAHSRRATITGGTVSGQTSTESVPFTGGSSSHSHTYDGEDTSEATVQLSGSNASHSHSIYSLPLSQNNVNINFTSGLSVGDKVIVIIAQDKQLYYVMDKVV